MSHEIETCFTVGEAPWHGLGTILDTPPATSDVLTHAGLVWDVGVVPTYLASGKLAPACAVIRSDTGEPIASCGEGYTPLQAAQLLASLSPLADAGYATWESGGSLRDGARQWLQVRLQGMEADIVPGDTIRAFALATNAHDGTQAARVGDVCTRVVCQNTLSAALREGTTKGAQHRRNVAQAWDDLSAAMQARVARFAKNVEAYRHLATITLDQAMFNTYITDVFRPESEEAGKALVARVAPLMEQGRGSDIPGVRGTMWGALNAVSEYVQHERKGSGAQRLDALMFGGTSKAINDRAMALALAA